MTLSESNIFFDNNEDLETLKEVISDNCNILEEPDRAEYGDFQTNENLANKIIAHLASKKRFTQNNC